MKKKIIIFFSCLVVILLAVIIACLVYLNHPVTKYKEQLALGEKYLKELDYEEAVAAFQAAIEIEPRNADAYLGLADAYIELGEVEKALEILEQGYDETGSSELNRYLKKIKRDLEKEEINLEISQIDTGDFPNITLYFSVYKDQDDYIEDATTDEVKVYEGKGDEWNEVSGQMRFLQGNESEPRSVAFVMDVSGSMDYDLPMACDSAKFLLQQMKASGNYQASLTAFDSSWTEICPYTGNLGELEMGLDQLYAGGGTALYDTLEAVLYKTINQSGQKYILAFTDGADGGSQITPQELVSVANYYKVPIYIIAAVSGSSYDMQMIAEQSGGKYYQIDSISGLTDIYDEIFELQENLYAYTYQTSRMNEWCDVKVVYEEEDYHAQNEGDMLCQKPMQRERISNEVILDVSASSNLELQDDPYGMYSYQARFAWDGDDYTYWAEGASGDGIGEYLELTFDGYQKVNGIDLKNGCRWDIESYEKNNRIKTLKVTFSDGSQMQFELEDDFWDATTIDFAVPVNTMSLRLEIADVYRGNSYRDTCISDITVY